jgi:aspartyl-tRNA(Asn)/glutamyl-tRNA(Gln) amidotransferase subunit A
VQHSRHEDQAPLRRVSLKAATQPSATELVERSLSAARDQRTLGAFWALCAERATNAAVELDRRRRASEPVGPLAGSTLAVKDCFDIAGLPTTAGLPGPNRAAERDAGAVAALVRAGAIPIGKTAMDPLAWSTHGEAPGHPPCLNPRDRSLSPGGSSSGSGAAVAAGIAKLGLGTDLAGSVRIPASYCGIVGLKPAPRTVPEDGCLSVAPTFHVPGIMAGSVEDCRIAYEALSGAAAAACAGTLDELAADGSVTLERVRLDWSAKGFGRILAFELARDWGRRIDHEPERFPPSVRESAELGRAIPEDAYNESLKSMHEAHERLAERIGPGRVLACPTVPVPVPARELETVEESVRYTRLFSALGWAALSVPGRRDTAGRPVGLQLAAPGQGLADLLAAGEAVERVRRS